MKKGFIQIYTGDGKGKTTAALGLCFRAAGRKKRVLFAQFLKGIETGEMLSMADNPYIENLKIAETTRFFNTLPLEEQNELKERTAAEWFDLTLSMKSEKYDVIVLDEIMAALHHGLVEETSVLELMKEKPVGMEMILTGRNASENIIGLADLVTEMKKVKHYYDKGIVSRQGIEY